MDCGCEKGLVCAVEELLLLACFFSGTFACLIETIATSIDSSLNVLVVVVLWSGLYLC